MKNKLNVKELCIFALCGGVMYVSKLLMASIPNVHLVAMITIAVTLVYRSKALYALYTYVLLDGLFAGFASWWLPYLYVWLLPWVVGMLLPRDTIEKNRKWLCAIGCSICGFTFGTLYAPAMCVMYGYNFQGLIDWIIAGLPYDAIHGCSNFVLGLLIIPLAKAIKRAALQ